MKILGRFCCFKGEKFKMAGIPEFGGYATKYDLLCTDGRIIRPGAFVGQDGEEIPIVWNHMHDGPENVVGRGILRHRDDGMYLEGWLNDTEKGNISRKLVRDRNITKLSIWANKLVQKGGDVFDGKIREVSLVLSGANPGASIDTIMIHSDSGEEEAIIYSEDQELELFHSEEEENNKEEKEKPMADKETLEHADGSEKSIKDVLNTLNEEQKEAVGALLEMALEDDEDDEYDEGEDDMTHNVFDREEDNEDVISHADIAKAFNDAKRIGSMREAFHQNDLDIRPENVLSHADGDYGIENIDYLFPEARTINNIPDFIKRDDSWVAKFLSKVHKTPFTRIKSIHANITEDEARARGYIKGNLKKEEVFKLLKRQTLPCTVYKKQKLDRDDMEDITDLDVVAFMKSEMRGLLNEEIARAALIGDGRSSSDEDKINELCIRPIWTDDALYSIKKTVSVANSDTDMDKAKNFITAVIKARKDLKGSGTPDLWVTQDLLSDMLLITDTTGRDIYDSIDKLKKKLMVNDIITVEVMNNQTRTVDNVTHTLAGILINLNDYAMGTKNGGNVALFDDFDIDYNQMKYLMETRLSGAIIKPYAAEVFEFVPAT